MNMPVNVDTFFSELEFSGIKLGLEQTKELFAKTGNPDKRLRFIHIAGTNGKGSVGAMLSAALSSAGFKTGFYSSPHLVNIRERFRINGKAISEKQLLEMIEQINPHILEMCSNGMSPTYFEVTTVIAAAYFAKEDVDFVIWETGMGGRFDATNIVTPEVSVITGIGIDHSAYLGCSIEEIAFEKAGIVKHGIPLFCGELSKKAEAVIRKIASTLDSECYLTDLSDEIIIPNLSLQGDYQQKNAKLAVNILKYLSGKFNFNLETALESFNNIKWPGRFQILSDDIIIDGAHNPQAVKSLVSSLEHLFPGRKYSVIFASLSDKDIINALKILATIAEEFIFPDIKSPGKRKSVAPRELEKIINNLYTIPVKKAGSLPEAFKMVSKNKKSTLITGSLYLAGEALKHSGTPLDDVFDI